MKTIRQFKDRVKAVLATWHRARRREQIRRSAPPISRAQIAADLRAMGLAAGDVVFMHSSLKSLGFVEGGPETVLNAVYDAISPGGTLIVPTYYQPGGTIYATCQMKDYVFDPRIHGSNLGSLPAAFLQFPGIERSTHPTHSVSALGRHARFVTQAHHGAPSIFGPGSPWDRCIELNGKVLGLGVSMGPVTFYHVLEDRMGDRFPLPVRMKQTYRLACKHWDGKEIEVPVVPLDPAYMLRRIDAPGRDDLRRYFRAEFERAGLLHGRRVGQADSWYVESQAFYDHLAQLMQEGITIYSTAEELVRRPLR